MKIYCTNRTIKVMSQQPKLKLRGNIDKMGGVRNFKKKGHLECLQRKGNDL